ncbi:MAG: hypothetical protein KF751_17080, partial [Nitrospira sp.]|nr:hypothetical protein [Nitrospira sp.]
SVPEKQATPSRLIPCPAPLIQRSSAKDTLGTSLLDRQSDFRFADREIRLWLNHPSSQSSMHIASARCRPMPPVGYCPN